MKCIKTKLFFIVFLSVAANAFVLPAAFAHEPRLIGGGALNVAVGWRSEPAYEGVINAFDLIITDKITVKNIDLKVKVLYLKKDAFDAKVKEKAELEGQLRRDRSNPNRFNISFLPSEEGAYGFHFVGLINGIAVDERFVCRGGSQNTAGRSFGCVIELQEFPDDD